MRLTAEYLKRMSRHQDGLHQPHNRPVMRSHSSVTTFLHYALLILKIIPDIHPYVRRLWLKRTPLVRRTKSPANPVSIIVDPRIISHVAASTD